MKQNINCIIYDYSYRKLEQFGMYELTLILTNGNTIIQRLFISDLDIDIDNYMKTYISYF
jgi:hypothetical protein